MNSALVLFRLACLSAIIVIIRLVAILLTYSSGLLATTSVTLLPRDEWREAATFQAQNSPKNQFAPSEARLRKGLH